MHKSIYILVIAIILITPAVIADQEYHYAGDMTLRQDISNQISISQTGKNFFIDHFDITLKLYPQSDNRQEILQKTIYPDPIGQNEEVFFQWMNPTPPSISFDTSTVIKTSGKYPTLITSKVDFPLTTIPNDILPYIEFTENIDGNGDITSLASSLANNKDDLFMIEFALADWVNKNIEYNLSSITSDVNQPSSWVLSQGYGVCDEITNLFISLNRALGIPARFVSGIAYSDSILFTEKWGNHGWAEVYFPGYGWVPYDVTYNQLGYIDATHIALHKGVDGSDSSVEYSSVGRDFTFQQQGLQFETQIIDTGTKRSSVTSIDLNIQEDPVAIGSYNLVKATITNNKPYYITDWYSIGKTTNLQTLSPTQQRVALPPKSKTTLWWLIKIDNDLDKKYYYTFPLVIRNSLGDETKTEFIVRNTAEMYQKDYMEQFITKEESYKILPITCSTPDNILLDQDVEATCFSSEELSVCHKDDCQQGKRFVFPLETTKIGVFTYKLNSADRIYFLTFKVSDLATLAITDFSFPEEVHFGKQQSITVTLNKTSWASPNNISLIIDHDLFSQEWTIDSLNGGHVLEVLIPTNYLTLGKNTLTATATYTDNTGQQKQTVETTTTRLINLTLGQKLQVLFTTAGAAFDKHVTKQSEKLENRGLPESKLIVIFIEMFIALAVIVIIQRIIHKAILRRS